MHKIMCRFYVYTNLLLSNNNYLILKDLQSHSNLIISKETLYDLNEYLKYIIFISSEKKSLNILISIWVPFCYRKMIMKLVKHFSHVYMTCFKHKRRIHSTGCVFSIIVPTMIDYSYTLEITKKIISTNITGYYKIKNSGYIHVFGKNEQSFSSIYSN